MSRIGKKPINLPAGVEVKVDDKNVVTVKGPKGELQEKVSELLTIENKDLSKKIKDNEANSQIAVTQMSFDTIGDNNLKDEILNLDLLNMTPLDAINALYSLQKKAKNN